MFDPYRKWLGIRDTRRPPTHYQLLGISPDEQDRDVINAAVVRQSAFVRTFQVGQYCREATQILNEIAAAKVCLLDRTKRAKYDAELTKRTAPSLAAPPGIAANPRGPSPSTNAPSALPRKPPHAVPRPPSPPSPAGAAITPAPLVPADFWSEPEPQHLQPVLRSLRRVRASVPRWAWLAPAGSAVFVVVITTIVLLARRPVEVSSVDEQHPLPTEVSATTSSPVSSAPIEGAPAVPHKPRRTKSAAERLDVDRPLLRIGATVDIPASHSSFVTFARAHGPFVAVGPSVYSLISGDAVGKIEPAGNSVNALSADGRYYAKGKVHRFDVWDSKTGECLAQFEPAELEQKRRGLIGLLDCVGPDLVVSSTQFSSTVIQLWNLGRAQFAKHRGLNNLPKTVGRERST